MTEGNGVLQAVGRISREQRTVTIHPGTLLITGTRIPYFLSERDAGMFVDPGKSPMSDFQGSDTRKVVANRGIAALSRVLRSISSRD